MRVTPAIRFRMLRAHKAAHSALFLPENRHGCPVQPPRPVGTTIAASAQWTTVCDGHARAPLPPDAAPS